MARRITTLLLYYSNFIGLAFAAFVSNNTTTPTTRPDTPLTSTSFCPCSITIYPVSLKYPTAFHLSESIVTATVIPVIEVYPNGTEVTVTSTFGVYESTTNQSFVAPTPLLLTWATLGVTLTYPTTYIAYESPDLVYGGGNGKQCDPTPSPESIPLAGTDTANLIFPQTDDSLPATGAAISYIDSLPTLTALLDGGNAATCSHIIPVIVPAATPLINPFEATTYTTVSVLTQTGNPVTIAKDPLPNDTPPSNTPTPTLKTENAPQPQTEQGTTTTTPAPAPSPVIIPAPASASVSPPSSAQIPAALPPPASDSDSASAPLSATPEPEPSNSPQSPSTESASPSQATFIVGGTTVVISTGSNSSPVAIINGQTQSVSKVLITNAAGSATATAIVLGGGSTTVTLSPSSQKTSISATGAAIASGFGISNDGTSCHHYFSPKTSIIFSTILALAFCL